MEDRRLLIPLGPDNANCVAAANLQGYDAAVCTQQTVGRISSWLMNNTGG